MCILLSLLIMEHRFFTLPVLQARIGNRHFVLLWMIVGCHSLEIIKGWRLTTCSFIQSGMIHEQAIKRCLPLLFQVFSRSGAGLWCNCVYKVAIRYNGP